MGQILHVLPGELRLPPSRQFGADPFKLADQIRRFGNSFGMPPLLVILGSDNEFMIIDGATRASRMAKFLPGATIAVEIIDSHPGVSLRHLRRVKETL